MPEGRNGARSAQALAVPNHGRRAKQAAMQRRDRSSDSQASYSRAFSPFGNG